ncbi:hypothetical protein RRG08_051881 [Elysia crispata]|uniref:Uncharacterized protein n=1 Tax=Elysia crispata TaxID=231223 RepID=A0AAE0Z9B1_9GAST|nr:hypothetical protein RRG08_051881 [Elysia crispata]
MPSPQQHHRLSLARTGRSLVKQRIPENSVNGTSGLPQARGTSRQSSCGQRNSGLSRVAHKLALLKTKKCFQFRKQFESCCRRLLRK